MRNDARVSAVRRCERAADLEFLTKRTVGLAGHRIVRGWSSNALLSSAQHPGRRMNGTEQILGDLAIVQDRVCDPWHLKSFGMDVGAPERDRASEGLRKLDLVMLAVTINVNDCPFAAFGQNAALALDRTPQSHDAEFRNLECIVHYSANPLLADFIGRGETKSMGELAGRCVRILCAGIR